MIPYCIKCARDLVRVHFGWFCLRQGCEYQGQQIPRPLLRAAAP